MRTIAKQLGLSDVGLKKICSRHNIPTPPQGYWEKLAHGKKVMQIPLPASGNTGDRTICFMAGTRPSPEIEAAQSAVLSAARKQSPIVVPDDIPGRLHSAAAATEKALRKAPGDREGFLHLKEPGCVAMSVGRGSISRTARIIHAFACGLEERGYGMEAHDGGVYIVIEGAQFDWRLTEQKERTTHKPTAAELKAQVRYDIDRARYPNLYIEKKVYPLWDDFPSGRLVMTLESTMAVAYSHRLRTRNWRDRDGQRLEGRLDKIMETLIANAVALGHYQKQKDERDHLLELERERAWKERQRNQRLLRRQEYLAAKAEKYAAFNRLMNFEVVLREGASKEANGPLSVLHAEMRELIATTQRSFESDAIAAEITTNKLFEDEDLLGLRN